MKMKEPIPVGILVDDKDARKWSWWHNLTESQETNLIAVAKQLKVPISCIEDDKLRSFCLYCLSYAHPRFWEAPCSTTGKYHPPQHNEISEVVPGVKVGGIIAHTWHALAAAFEALRRYGYRSSLTGPDKTPWAELRDQVAFSIILHDFAKGGNPIEGIWGDHTHPQHGEIAAAVIEEHLLPQFLLFSSSQEQEEGTNEDFFGIVRPCCAAIANHYGVWSSLGLAPDAEGLTTLDRIVQEGDYWSSRSFIASFNQEAILTTLYHLSPRFLRRFRPCAVCNLEEGEVNSGAGESTLLEEEQEEYDEFNW